MSGEPKMFRINPENRESEAISEVEFARLGFQERRDIQEWVAANPVILGDDLLIIGKEFSGFDRTSERLDLLAVDWDGKLVVIELKRDDSGSDAHWQAIKYASYFRHATADDIVGMLASYDEMTEAEATSRLLQHLQADDFTALNHDQRIILASHRFAPEVTSAVLWLNDRSPDENLITCVQLVPYHDLESDTLYVQASTIIPLPGIDNYVVKVGDNSKEGRTLGGSSLGEKLSRTFARNINDEVTPFLRRVGDLATSGLPQEIRPDKRSRWGVGQPTHRYYRLWYSSPPWNRRGMYYRVNLYPQGGPGEWQACAEFRHDQNGLDEWLNDNAVYARLEDCLELGSYNIGNGVSVEVGQDTLNDAFGDKIAAMVQRFVEEITPLVNAFEDEGNEEEV